MEKLPFFIHGMSITDQAAASNVGPEHRLPCSSESDKIDRVNPQTDSVFIKDALAPLKTGITLQLLLLAINFIELPLLPSLLARRSLR
jgi:hypothetical protein